MVLQKILCAVLRDDVNNKTKLRRLFGTCLYSKKLSWLNGATIKKQRLSQILYKCFGEGPAALPSKEYKQIVEFDNKEIAPFEMLSLEQESIYKRWERMLAKNNIPANAASRLELAIFLTAVLASDLVTSGEEQISSFVRTYYTAFGILGIECEDNLLRLLCPENFVKAKEDWSRAITGKEYQDRILPYDLLCLTIYLALWRLRYPADAEADKKNFAKLWLSFLHFCSMEPEFDNANQSVNSVIQAVHRDMFAGSETRTQPEISSSELSRNNDLFRDPRFLRQANLYYNVDMQAIFHVLNNFQRSDLTVLDLGCGDAEVTCSRFGGIAAVSKIICIDSDAHQVETAKARIERDPHCDKFSVYQVNLQDNDLVYQLRSILKENNVEKIDIVFSALAFHYLSSPESVLSHIRTIMAEDGFVIIRELDDHTKLYYSQGDIKSAWMEMAINSYQKISQYSDRNCARKMHSWLSLNGFSDIKLFYDQIDTCGKTQQERKDIFYIMVGFRKARAEKLLRNQHNDAETEKYLSEVVRSCDELEKLFSEEDFWFFFTNYVAVARNSKYQADKKSARPIIELYLVRHAHTGIIESDSNLSFAISERGDKEIIALTERLRSIEFDEIVCSTMERAIQTAMPIAASHGITLEQYPELIEIDRGAVITDSMWTENYSEYYSHWKRHETDLQFPNGENGADVWVRAKFVIDRICENAAACGRTDRPYRACVITHGGTIRAMLCGLLGIPEQLRYQFAYNLHPCSISTLRIAEDPSDNVNTDYPLTLELFNDISHLREKL